jgi:hypothetical protein
MNEPARVFRSPRPAPDDAFVFNVVWTGTVFTYLRLFVASQLDHTGARYRFVANGCPPDQIDAMEAFAARHPQVVEVLDVSPEMVAHGVALDRVRAIRDDGEYFCLIDPDIKAKTPFVAEFSALLADGYGAVTSGKEVWSDDNLVPVDHPGVAGEFFYDRKGFVFGSPHLALYERAALDETTERWGVGLGSAGPDLSDAATARMAEMGHEYLVYDTGKIVNALLQADGTRLVHRDLPQLIHIGGLSHYLSPAEYITLDDGEVAPEFARWGLNDRYQVSRFTALTLRNLCDGGPEPAVPSHLGDSMAQRMAMVKDEVTELVAEYRSW